MVISIGCVAPTCLTFQSGKMLLVCLPPSIHMVKPKLIYAREVTRKVIDKRAYWKHLITRTKSCNENHIEATVMNPCLPLHFSLASAWIWWNNIFKDLQRSLTFSRRKWYLHGAFWLFRPILTAFNKLLSLMTSIWVIVAPVHTFFVCACKSEYKWKFILSYDSTRVFTCKKWSIGYDVTRYIAHFEVSMRHRLYGINSDPNILFLSTISYDWFE